MPLLPKAACVARIDWAGIPACRPFVYDQQTHVSLFHFEGGTPHHTDPLSSNGARASLQVNVASKAQTNPELLRYPEKVEKLGKLL